jgi:AcrR family transcriptional regulator
MITPVSVHRGPGRPRRARADAAILDAVRELLAEEGYDSLSVERVAQRAGVSKATIYRRHPSKASLVVEALHENKRAAVEYQDTGDLRADLVRYLAGIGRAMSSDDGHIMAGLVSAVARNPELADAMRSEYIEPRRRQMLEIFRAAVDRGDLRDDVDPRVLGDVLVGALQHRFLVTGDPTGRKVAEQIVDLVLSGATPRS